MLAPSGGAVGSAKDVFPLAVASPLFGLVGRAASIEAFGE